ncbi:hypothetical protein CASFOL_020726 [Castilleja foliolosa]|uniref:Uncharacterized protein n=1 Tax=Castilleja foliolosa TaxID=1961234 RepID=A0ABD3D302_9LAMI
MAELKLIILCLAITTLFLQTLIKFLHRVWWAPVRLQSKMGSQGDKESKGQLFPHGNTKQISYMRTRSMEKPLTDISHDIFPRIQPHVYHGQKNMPMGKFSQLARFGVPIVRYRTGDDQGDTNEQGRCFSENGRRRLTKMKNGRKYENYLITLSMLRV